MQSHLPQGSTIGFLGAGQLARMTAHSAQRLGYKTICWSGGGDASPTLQVAGEVIQTTFDCVESLQRMLTECDVITVETENIPTHLLDAFTGKDILRPRSQAVRIAGDRRLEREFIAEAGLNQTQFAVAKTDEQIRTAFTSLGDCVAKTARDGYDGKGQWRIHSTADVETCIAERGDHELVIEQFVHFELEISILVARSASGEISVFDPAENIHRHHVLDTSIVPARISSKTATEVKSIAEKVVTSLDYTGILAIEMFITSDGNVLINELAPRPHNSGHHTMDACVTSQFDMHLRAICNLPLTSTKLLCPAVMVNLISDQWSAEVQGVNHPEYLKFSQAVWHLYDKKWVAGRRKLGHVNIIAETQAEALDTSTSFRNILNSQTSLLYPET